MYKSLWNVPFDVSEPFLYVFHLNSLSWSFSFDSFSIIQACWEIPTTTLKVSSKVFAVWCWISSYVLSFFLTSLFEEKIYVYILWLASRREDSE